MDRKEELTRLFDDVDDVKDIILPLIDDVVFLEEQLRDLRKLPFLRINENNPSLQKATVASKQYKEFLQQYNNCLKTLCSALTKNGVDEDSPLREFIKNYGVKK